MPNPAGEGWYTYVVISHKEQRLLPYRFPAFTVGGELVIYLKDLVDDTRVPIRCRIEQVIFDVYNPTPTQWVHVTEVFDDDGPSPSHSLPRKKKGVP